MKKKFWMLGLGILFFIGCSALLRHNVNYDIALHEVERPAEIQERYGAQKIFISDQRNYPYNFEDKMIKISWRLEAQQFFFMLENKTNHSIIINWDEVTLVDTNGQSHKITHHMINWEPRLSQISLAPALGGKKDKAQSPTVIVRKASTAEVIVPTDFIFYVSPEHVEYHDGIYTHGWHIRHLFAYTQLGGDPQELLKKAKEYIGKTIQVLLPLQIERTVYDYIFVFEVINAELSK